ncbi:hypothetical protein CTI12_AA317630 [Artemisia annua]|uniref:Uncharacterized protein n=1 Tax=Artemisia annua TaxID=35608 RepID=A0A2U1N236_ARTAN|nr:hypothetical protein CTI12_AA317630 [Artemisia annua]
MKTKGIENPTLEREIKLTRKVEELKKEQIAATLKEQLRLEEKAKGTEALERKKRNAEKAQIRAELRARKEAEQKEKKSFLTGRFWLAPWLAKLTPSRRGRKIDGILYPENSEYPKRTKAITWRASVDSAVANFEKYCKCT